MQLLKTTGAILSIDDLIEKCVEHEAKLTMKRKQFLSRFFVNLDTATQRTIPKAIKPAPRWKISRVRMATFDHDTQELLFSYGSCGCDLCLDGQFMSCSKWPVKMKNKIKRSEIQSYFEENSQPVESSQPDHSQIFEPQMPQEIDPIDSHEQKVEKTIVGLDAPRLTPELIAQNEEMSDDEETEPTFTRHRKKEK